MQHSLFPEDDVKEFLKEYKSEFYLTEFVKDFESEKKWQMQERKAGYILRTFFGFHSKRTRIGYYYSHNKYLI